MKILLCNERFLFRFGADRVLLLLGKGLKRRGHTVYVMANRFDPEPIKAFADKIIEVPQGGDGYLNLNEFTAEWLKAELPKLFSGDDRPDVAFVGGWPFFAAIPVFRSLGIKVVFHDYGAVPLDGFKDGQLVTQEKLRSLRREHIPSADAVLSISGFIADSQSKRDCAGRVPVRAILLGADHLETNGALPKRSPFLKKIFDSRNIADGPGLKVVLNLGRWEKDNYKNSAALIELMQKVRGDVPGVVALVLSDGADMEIPEDLKKQIVPIGYPSDRELQEIMAGVDAGVSVSLWEGFNLPLAEMQWLGKPVVVFNIGAHPEVVAHSWYLAEDLAQMAAKLSACLGKKGLSREEHQGAIERFRANFRWEQVVDRYERALISLMPVPAAAEFSALRILVDVSNSSHDPANSGVIRVTRSLCRALQAWCKPVFVLWDRTINAYVYPTAAEYSQLNAFNGPERMDYHRVSPDNGRVKCGDSFAQGGNPGAGWLLLPEIVMEANGKNIRAFAKRSSLQVGVIFYDAIPLIRPDLCKDEVIRRNHSDYMDGLAECRAIFPISEFSGRCLGDYWREKNIPPAQVLPALLPGEFRAGPRITRPSLFNPNRIDILCVSTLEPRKNQRSLLAALKLLSKDHPDIDWSLTLVGNRYAGGDDLARMVETACAEDPRIRWLGIADDKALRQLYETCSFTVYPSFIEGYGMPIVESLWHAKPCICHEQGVMAELAEDGGCLTTDVLDVQKLSRAIYLLATDRALYDRLSQQAAARPIKNWDDYAREMLAHMLQMTPAIPRTPPHPAIENSNNESPSMTTAEGIPQQPARAKSWPDILYPGCLTENWQMNESERLALTALLHRHKPRCSIEIGTFKGGSLSLIAQYSEMVFSIDIDPTVAERFSFFKNVSFLTGPSQVILPRLFDELDRQGIPVDFILIDGDHSAAGVKRDLDLVFQYAPKAPMFVMMHDGFNPECRRGMREANWKAAKHLRWADIDFIPGRLTEHGGGGQGELWGGLGCAYFEPGERGGPVGVSESARQMQMRVLQFKDPQRA